MRRVVTLTELPVLRRLNHFFPGQLLTAEDLHVEQRYQRERSRLHNQLLHGSGVVAGLEVRSWKGRIIVSPGVALDRGGNEVILGAETEVATISATGKPGAKYVVIRHVETLADPIPVAGDDPELVAVHYRHVIEGAECSVQDAEPSRTRSDVVLARILWRTSQWRVDPRYRRPKVR